MDKDTQKCIDALVAKEDGLQQEIKALNEVISMLRRVRDDRNKFSCPLGLEDPICPKCEDKMMPETHQWQNKIHLTWPYGTDDAVKNHFNFHQAIKDGGCLEWKKKTKTSACGCAGVLFCVCGYNEAFCYKPTNTKCEFCGRICCWRGAQPIIDRFRWTIN